MSNDTDVLVKQDTQRKQAKRATFEKMRTRKPAWDEFEVTFPGDEDPSSFLFIAIGGFDYDALVTKSPPSLEQKSRGAVYDPEKLGPKILAAVCREPLLTEEEWIDISKNPAWSGGDWRDLVNRAIDVCTKGLDPTPIAAG